jgi:hypothetical protein
VVQRLVAAGTVFGRHDSIHAYGWTLLDSCRRVTLGRQRRDLLLDLERAGQAVRLRHVDESHGDLAFGAVAQRLPFRREDGEGIEDGEIGRLRRIDQQRHRRRQPHRQQGQHFFGIGRPLTRSMSGPQGLERAAAAGAARTVMTDAEREWS